jgi:hypothetical protein
MRPMGGRELCRWLSGRGDRDKYVRDTVFASVLFLGGISSHSPLRQARDGLIGIGTLILILGVVQLLGLPGPPGGL